MKLNESIQQEPGRQSPSQDDVHSMCRLLVQFNGIYALGEAHNHALHLVSRKVFPTAAFETVPIIVQQTMAISRPFQERRPVYG